MSGADLLMAALLGLPVAGVLLLAVPVGAAFRVQGIDDLQGWFTVRWLFGLVRLEWRLPGASANARRTQRARRSRALAARVGRGARGSPDDALGWLRNAGVRRRVVRLVADLLGAVRVHDLRLHLRCGLGDPADTGRLWAVLGPCSVVAGGFQRADIRIEPEFAEAMFEFDAGGRCELVPLRLLLPAITFALSPAMLRAWRTTSHTHRD